MLPFLNLEEVSQITGRTIGKVVVVNSMHERKAEMARLSDAFIALPGERKTSLFSIVIRNVNVVLSVRASYL